MDLVDTAEFDHLPVEVIDSTPASSLEPELDGEQLMLCGELPADPQFPFGANVDSLLILDLDELRTVAQIEVLVPSSLWRECDELPPAAWPDEPPPRAGLRIPGTTRETYVEGPDPTHTYATRTQRLLIELERGDDGRWVSLSERCHARVASGRLAALAVDLAA